MANKRTKKATGKKNTAKRAPRVVAAVDKMGSMLAAYDRMLTDPCGAIPVPAPYLGMGSGYVIRTTETYQPTAGAIGAVPGPGVISFFATYTPGAPQLIIGSQSPTVAAGLASSVGLTAWPIVNTATVKRFRPLAACMKYVNTGTFTNRRGEIGTGYIVGQPITSGGAWSANSAMQQQLRRVPCGSEPHEANWLPSGTDGDFINLTFGNAQGGTVTLCAKDVDAIYTNATTAVAQGYIELTTIWEWEPVSSADASSATIVQAPKAPPSFTLNDYLGRVKDVGAFVTRGIGAIAQATGYNVIAEGAYYASSVLTGGVKPKVVRGRPAMLTYN